MNRAQRTIVILASTALILMILFPPVTATITGKPGPLPGKPYTVVDGVRPEREKTAIEYSAEAYETLMKDRTPRVAYRFFALPPTIGSAAETVDYGSNIMLSATYGVAWTVFVTNAVVLFLVTGAAFLIASPTRSA